MKAHSFKTSMFFNNLRNTTLVSILSLVVLTGCHKDDDGGYPGKPNPGNVEATVLIAAGDSAAIISTVKQFRSLLGDSLNTTPNKTSGRREINWDAVPAALTNNGNFPFNFFNSTNPTDGAGRKRGLLYANGGVGFRVDSSSFSEIDPSYANQFSLFSKKRMIAFAGGVKSNVVFKVPGTDTNAFVRGFGAIFSDVDDASSTTLEFFSGAKSLGTYNAPARNAAGGLSFLGVNFKDEKVTKVSIKTGSGFLATGVKDITDGGSKDLVVMDDFFYSEPAAK